MKAKALLLFSSVICLSPAFAEVTGKVTLKGAPPVPDKPIRTVADPRCKHEGNLTTENWKVAPDGALADVVVAVQKAPASATAGSGTALMDQVGCQYIPHVLAVEKGTTVTFKNSDKTLHNVHAIEYPGKTGKGKDLFNVGQPVQNMTTPKKFDQLGVVKVKCDVHPWMLAFVYVSDSPMFAVTGADGSFKLPPGLADGDYEVQAWHAQFDKPLVQKLTVKDGAGTLNFEFAAPTPAAAS